MSRSPAAKPKVESWKERLDRRLRDDDTKDIQINPGEASRDANEVRILGGGPNQINMREGGRVRKVAGPKLGKEDGLIAVQKGEFVVRRAAVKQQGGKKMAALNAGKAKIVPKTGKRS